MVQVQQKTPTRSSSTDKKKTTPTIPDYEKSDLLIILDPRLERNTHTSRINNHHRQKDLGLDEIGSLMILDPRLESSLTWISGTTILGSRRSGGQMDGRCYPPTHSGGFAIFTAASLCWSMIPECMFFVCWFFVVVFCDTNWPFILEMLVHIERVWVFGRDGLRHGKRYRLIPEIPVGCRRIKGWLKDNVTHTINVWYIYLHLAVFTGKIWQM